MVRTLLETKTGKTGPEIQGNACQNVKYYFVVQG